MAENTNEITVQNSSVPMAVQDFKIPEGFICTFDLSSEDGQLAMITATNMAVSMKDIVDVPISVRNIMTMPGVRMRTGEPCINSYFETVDGTIYMSQSSGIAKSLPIIIAACTNQITGEFTAPCDKGWNLVVRSQVLPNGNTYKSIVPIKA